MEKVVTKQVISATDTLAFGTKKLSIPLTRPAKNGCASRSGTSPVMERSRSLAGWTPRRRRTSIVATYAAACFVSPWAAAITVAAAYLSGQERTIVINTSSTPAPAWAMAEREMLERPPTVHGSGSSAT